MRYRVPARLAWLNAPDFVEWDDGLYLMHVPDGVPMILKGAAAVIWLAAASGEDPVATMIEMAESDADVVAADTTAFLADLVNRRLLEPLTLES